MASPRTEASGSRTNGRGGARREGAGGGGAGRDPGQSGAPPALDMLLTEGATGSGATRWFPGRAGVTAAAKLAVRPHRVARRGAGLAAELARVAAGRSELEPGRKDRRFKDPAWQGNPGFRRLCQAYLAAGKTVDELIDDLALDWRAERRVRFAAENVLDALAPSNLPLTNPSALKAAIDTGGGNFVRGLGQLARDMAKPPRIPSMVDESAFEVGENIAVSPGAVVLRTEVFELIQYAPRTERVREIPLVVVPPMINKYYVTDLAPGRSLVEHLVGEGQTVFAISWRNPGQEQGDWDLDTYAGAVIEAFDAAGAISGSDSIHALGLCAGGMVLSIVAAHLADHGRQDRLAGLTLGVCVLDNQRMGTTGAFVDRPTAAMATAESARKGYLDGRALAGVFAWLRPNDLVWNYWINNYLLGKDPPAFDVLFWNADTTRLPAGLHRDFMEISLENSLIEPGALTVLGSPVDLSQVTAELYAVAGIADHISPWESCYRSARLFGSEPRFVLSTSGHIAAMVNPPGNEKASYQLNDEAGDDPEAWLRGAAKQPGTWWDDWAAWLGERSGPEHDAPAMLGGAGYDPLDEAPGTYVHVR
jgi:polyhydroxyalkanoate synthase subunit PhaC